MNSNCLNNNYDKSYLGFLFSLLLTAIFLIIYFETNVYFSLVLFVITIFSASFFFICMAVLCISKKIFEKKQLKEYNSI